MARKDVYIVFVYQEDCQGFFELVGTTIERKIHLWRLSVKKLWCYSRKFGRAYLKEVKSRSENSEDWADVLMF